MKKLISISMLTLMLCLSVNAFAQRIYWETKLHSTDPETLKAEIAEMADIGYVPMGITYDNKELYILHVRYDDMLSMDAWAIEWYENRDAIQAGITARMEDDYMPTGITYTGDLLYVLYIQSENSATAWQLIPSATDLQSVEQAIQSYVSQGYVPMGITFYQNEYWTLLVQISDTSITRYLIESYDVNGYGENVDAAIENGYVPWGIEFTGQQRIDVLYVGF